VLDRTECGRSFWFSCPVKHSRLFFLTGALTVLAALALSGSAFAATVSIIDVTTPIEDDPGEFETTKTPALIAAPGEANRVTVRAQANPATVFYEDLGATITVGAGCVSADAHHASCLNETSATPIVNAGDLNDVVMSTPSASMDANGGPGVDALIGSDQPESLNGGGGAGDVVTGGAGDDTLSDGDGVNGAAVDADKLDGGAGEDTVSYEARTAAVSVDLSDALPDGQAAEGDVLTAFENVTGGNGADHITGTIGNNTVQSGPGADVISTGKGNDRVYAGKGNDRIDTGAGKDTVYPEAGNDRVSLGSGNDLMDETFGRSPTGNDRVACGAGRDEIEAIQDKSIDKLARDCERFNASETIADGNFVANALGVTVQLRGVHRSGATLLVPVKCARQKGDKACIISGEVRTSGGHKIGGPLTRLKVKARTTRTLRMVLTRAGMKRARHGKKVRLLISEHSHDPGFELLSRARSQAQIVVH